MNLEEIADKLTWHPLNTSGTSLSDYQYIDGIEQKFGILVKTKDGNIYEIGEYSIFTRGDRISVYDRGCGCCSDDVSDCVSIAFLSEYIEELSK